MHIPDWPSTLAKMARFWPLLAVSIGGVAGSLARWGVLSAIDNSTGLAVFGLNVFGSLFLGLLFGQRERLSANGYNLLGTGFAGGLTTFSRYAVDVAAKLEDGSLLAAFGSGLATPITTVVAAGLGYRVSRAAGIGLMKRQTMKRQTMKRQSVRGR